MLILIFFESLIFSLLCSSHHTYWREEGHSSYTACCSFSHFRAVPIYYRKWLPMVRSVSR